MRITLLSNVMEHPTPLAKGDVIERPDGVAEDWIARGLAVATPHEARVIQATPAEAFAAVAVAAEAVHDAAPSFGVSARDADTVVVPTPRRRRGA